MRTLTLSTKTSMIVALSRPGLIRSLLACGRCLLPARNVRATGFQQTPPTPAAGPTANGPPQAENLIVPKAIHLAGIPKTSRNTRGDLILTRTELIFRRGERELL